MLALRRSFGRLPSPPRCKLCYAPFHGIGGVLLKPWFGPWERNPQLCKNCMKALTKQGVGGAEVEISMLFVDIRGSTGLGERLGPAAFAALLTAFYRLAADAIVETDGVVDKFVGDEAIGLYIPSYAGRDHARKAIDGGRRIIEATARSDASASGPIPVGGGVHTGIAYVGTLGSSEEISDFTALGDSVNTTARLASLAGPGELLVSLAAAEHASLDATGLDRRTVEVRGREATLDVYALRPAPAGDGARRSGRLTLRPRVASRGEARGRSSASATIAVPMRPPPAQSRKSPGMSSRLRDRATRDRADDRGQPARAREQALRRSLETRRRPRREDGHAADEDAGEADALERGDEDERSRRRRRASREARGGRMPACRRPPIAPCRRAVRCAGTRTSAGPRCPRRTPRRCRPGPVLPPSATIWIE